MTIHVIGKVQGVWYRQGTKEKAEELGITGTVQNLPDGSVYIIATGMPAQLESLVSWCRMGPPRARVLSVETTDAGPQVFESFTILRS